MYAVTDPATGEVIATYPTATDAEISSALELAHRATTWGRTSTAAERATALRRLGDAAAAEKHFARVGEGSRSAITRARSLYWQGVAAAARSRTSRAGEFFAAAAALPVAFYGQLASLALGEDGAVLAARINGVPVPEARPPESVREIAAVPAALAAIGLGAHPALRVEAAAAPSLRAELDTPRGALALVSL